MADSLRAGAARRTINPQLGLNRPGLRLFADPIEAIESDLTATAVVISDGDTKVVLVALDLMVCSISFALDIRRRIGEVVGTPASHVLLNLSHTHSAGAFPEWIPDEPDQMRMKAAYKAHVTAGIIEAATEADQGLQPARIGAGWGKSDIGIYRRETGPDGRDVLGEVPDAPIDDTVGVIRIDDLDGRPIAILFSYGCHTVTMGPRSMVASSDFPGPARDLVEQALGGCAMFLQACGGNINPRHGIGYEVDCTDTKNRTGMRLGAEVVQVAADIRTNVRRAESRRPMDSIPNILFWSWGPVSDEQVSCIRAVDETMQFRYGELPTLAEAESIHQEWQERLAQAETNDVPKWERMVAQRFLIWSGKLVDAVKADDPTFDAVIQAIRINDIVLAGISVEAFFETGLAVRADSPFPFTQLLGFTNGCEAYLPRAEDYPAGGWKLTESYAVPDLLVQSYNLPVAFHPDTEQQVVQRMSALIRQLV